MDGLGAGLAAFAFWGFIAAVVVGGIWYAAREKEAQHETLRRMIDSGRDLDEETISRVFKENGRPDRDLKIGGIIAASAAPGLAVLGWFLRNVSEEAFYALSGVAGLVAFVAVGLLVAAKIAERSYANDGRRTES
jgi:predicted permease